MLTLKALCPSNLQLLSLNCTASSYLTLSPKFSFRSSPSVLSKLPSFSLLSPAHPEDFILSLALIQNGFCPFKSYFETPRLSWPCPGHRLPLHGPRSSILGYVAPLASPRPAGAAGSKSNPSMGWATWMPTLSPCSVQRHAAWAQPHRHDHLAHPLGP